MRPRLAVQRNPLGYFGRLGRTIPRARFKVRARGSQGGHVSDIAEASADRTSTTSAQYKCAESRSDSPSNDPMYARVNPTPRPKVGATGQERLSVAGAKLSHVGGGAREGCIPDHI